MVHKLTCGHVTDNVLGHRGMTNRAKLRASLPCRVVSSCPARGYCVERSKKSCSCRPSVSKWVSEWVRHEIGHGSPIGTSFWNVCEGTVKFGGPKTDPFRSRWENERVSMIFELSEITYVSHVWTALRNSPSGATLALRVLSSLTLSDVKSASRN